ncbi:MAG: chemotaxis protein CheD [Methanomicrobiales archaeon]|nr:chemotaxis protein CheD [Methanomicrobiales archaeon]
MDLQGGEGESPTVIVGIGEYCVGNGVMSCIGLGSCIGLILHSSDRQVGSLAHVMLPAINPGKQERPGKYADTAVPLLLKEMIAKGCRRSSIVVKIAGGASMFKNFAGTLNIGERNVEAIREVCTGLNLSIVGDDTGGVVGRTIFYYPKQQGKIVVRRGDGTIVEI